MNILEYVIKAKDLSADVIRASLQRLKDWKAQTKQTVTQAAKETEEATEKVVGQYTKLANKRKGIAEEAQQDVDAVSAATAILSGNIQGTMVAVGKLAVKFKVLGMSMASLSIYTLVIMGIIKLFTWWRNSIDECNQKMREVMQNGMDKRMKMLARSQETLNKELERGNKAMQDGVKHMNALTQASVDRQKALNDAAKERELAGTSDETKRKEIERRYSTANEDLEAQGKKEQAARELDALEEQKRNAEKALEDQNKLVRQARKAREEARWELDHSYKEEDVKNGEELVKKAQAQLNSANDARQKLADQISSLTSEIEIKKSDMTVAEAVAEATLERRKREEKEFADEKEKELIEAEKSLETVEKDIYKMRLQAQKNGATEGQRVRLALMEEFYEKFAQCEDEAQRRELNDEYELQMSRLDFLQDLEDEEIREAEEVKAKKLEKEKELTRQRLANEKAVAAENLKAAQESLDLAKQRAQSAQDAVSKAWGWYKDPESLKQQIASEEKDLDAQRRYRKDYFSLTHGRWSDEFAEAKELQRLGHTDKLEERMAQWRKGAFGLSVEQEATMRVALAEDEARKANQDLARVAENTAILKDIYDELSGEGEEA